MTTKADRDNRTRLALELARLCPGISATQIARDVETLANIGARLHRHEERMCSYEDYYNSHTAEDGSDPTAERLEKKAAAIAAKFGATITARGDPRGYCLYVHKAGLRGNTWGGNEHGFGIN